MRPTVRCSACDATFFRNGTAAPETGPCPRCGQNFRSPFKAQPYDQPAISATDLLIPTFCSMCGCVLTAIERVGANPTCGFPACVHRRIRMELAAKRERALARRREQLDGIGRKLRELAVDLDPYPEIAILPANTRKLEPMTDVRRTEFAARLGAIADEIESGRGADSADPAERGAAAREPPDPDTARLACATCRGHCCIGGGNRAYLTRATFERVLTRSPTASLEDLQQAYLSRIPEVSYRDSCIFHGRTGCALPQGMRSDTCNDFLCSGIYELPQDPGEQRLAAAFDGQRLVRLAVIGPAGRTLLVDGEIEEHAMSDARGVR